MPYIPKADRQELDKRGLACSPGELNYQLTKVVDNYMSLHGKNYRTINDIVGALEGAKLEFYRRVAAPYEDTKLTINGDVYHDA